MKRLKKPRILSAILSFLLVINIILSAPLLVAAAATDLDATTGKSTANPPQSVTGKTELATWSYSASTTAAAVALDFPATSGYYIKTPAGNNSTLQLFRDNAKVTTGFGFSTSTISNSKYNGQTGKGYWLLSTSTKGFKNLIFNFNTRSSGTGPRDFNTEWSADGTNWTAFGNPTASTTFTVKIESTSPVEQYGMVLPAEAANQDKLYIRMMQKSEISESGATVASGGTHGVNNLQLYGTKDPLYTTSTVTAIPDITKPILDVTPITLACSDTSAQIFYTTDGTTPAAIAIGSTKLYTTPFTALSEGGFSGANPFVVNAIAKSGSLLPCDVVTSSFNQQTITLNADAKKLATGAYAWVKGIGTYLNGNATLYIQDGMNIGSGLCIYKSGADFSSYVGKEIYVYGKVSSYNGLVEITPDTVDSTNVVVRNSTPTSPTPTKIMFDQLSDRSYEGMMVAFDTVKLDTVAGTTVGSSYTHTVSQAGAQLKLRANGISSLVGTTGSYVNITKAIANYNSLASYGGVCLLSTNTADLTATTTPTVEFMTANVANGAAVPSNSKVTLATTTANATINYSLNGGATVRSAGNSVDVNINAFSGGKATITATATDGTYTTATQTFTYTQSQVAKVSANPDSSAIIATTPIAFSSTTANATIVYSLYKNSYSSTDGTLVGSANQTYTTPITVDASYFPIRIVAKATLANYSDSDTSNFTYTTKKSVGGEKNYYGSIHAHTAENSDGQGTLAEADAYARDQGKFDYFILTDHSNAFDKAAASDTVASIGNLNNYNTTNQQWINGKQAAAAATTANFLCDYGYEMTWSGGPGHINTFDTAGFVSRNNTVLNNKTNDAGMQAYYQLLKNTAGSVSQFNHPGPTFGNFSNFAYYDTAIDDKINLIEVGNGEGAVGSGGYFPSINQYILALDKGWHVAPTNNGDNHKKGWGTSNTCATVVYTNDYTMSGIYQAMRDHSVWATENRDLDVSYHLSDGTNTYSMGAILDAKPSTANITVTAKNKNPGTETSNIASIQLISNSGIVVNKKTYVAGNSDVTYTYAMTAPTSGYYFAKIIDNQGFIAVTAPIWLGSAPKVGITSVANSAVMPVTTESMNLTTTFFNNESTNAILKSVAYTVDGDDSANKSYNLGASIASLGSTTHIFSYTPTTAGTKTVNISAVITVNGVETTYTATSTMKVVDTNKVVYVGLDAAHGNEYVSGGSYPNSMTNMMTLAGSNSVRVQQLNTSKDFIDACNNPKYKMMILNAPSRKTVSAWPTPTNYSVDEIAALKTFSENGNTLVFGDIADYAEASNADGTTPKKHMSELQNDVLTAIGSTLREGDDEVMDDSTNGGQAYRLYPTEFNMSNPLLQGVVSGQTYSQYSGSTIYAVDPKTGIRTTTVPSTVSPLVYGFPTTYSAECDSDNFGYGTTKDTFPFVTVGTNKTDKGMSNSQGIYIPKYVNSNSSLATNPEEKLLAASENVVHSNGKTSLVVVAGGSFMSNFEIQVTMDSAATLPYANYNLMDNLYKSVNPETITSIAEAKNLADGTDAIIEATATSEVNTQNIDTNTNKGFFDCIYAQDATGGINLFPVGEGIKEGQKARFYGKITHYQGEVELTVTKFTIVDDSINKISSTALSTKDTMLTSNTGLLMKTQGIVSNIYKDNDGTINQFTINDGSGPAIVFINGYITKGTAIPFITEGATVSVVGLASIGEVVSDSNMHSRIRVRDRSDIVNIEKIPTVIVPTVTVIDSNSNIVATIDSSKIDKDKVNVIVVNQDNQTKAEAKVQVQIPASSIGVGTGSFDIDTKEVSLSIPTSIIDPSLLSSGGTLRVSQNLMPATEANALLAGIQAGAIANGRVFTFSLEVCDSNNNVVSNIHNFASGKSMVITIKLSNDDIKGMDTSKISAFYYDVTSKEWIDMGGSFDSVKMTYTITTTHLTDFTVMQKSAIVVDKTALTTAISNATTLLGSKTVGTAVGNVPQIAKDAFQSAITTAAAINVNIAATQVEVDAQIVTLATATTNFNNAVIVAPVVVTPVTGGGGDDSTGVITPAATTPEEVKPVVTPQPASAINRLSGLNRIETSIAIAKEQYTDKKPDAVVLATADGFADALAGSGLAYKNNAPLLLVNKTIDDSKNVLDYITTNLSKDKIVYILGETGVISKEISDYLSEQGYKVVRLGGKDRYETNQKIVDSLNVAKGTSLVIATGDGFADALSISSIADIKGFPVLLNAKDNLSANVSDDIINLQPTTVYVIGGEGVLSTNIEEQIKNLNGSINIVRLGGKDRYETSMMILDYFNLPTTTIALATGIDFPDALSGSVLAARKSSGVLLVDNKDVTKQKELLSKEKITSLIVFGGEGVIGSDIATSLIQK